MKSGYLAALGIAVALAFHQPPPVLAQTGTEAKPANTLELLPIKKRIKLARAGDVDAQMSVANSYEKGAGVRRSVVKAARYYRLAAQRGNVVAQYKLARILHNGAKGIKKAPNMSITLYESAASQGHADSQYWAGYSHHHGEGVKANPAKAAVWYQKAADGGNAIAQNNLGLLYLNGKGTGRDLGKAFGLFEKAAGLGNAWAMNNLAGMYEMGWGTKKNVDKALSFYEQAAAKEISHAQDNLRRLRKALANDDAKPSANGGSTEKMQDAAPDTTEKKKP